MKTTDKWIIVVAVAALVAYVLAFDVGSLRARISLLTAQAPPNANAAALPQKTASAKDNLPHLFAPAIPGLLEWTPGGMPAITPAMERFEQKCQKAGVGFSWQQIPMGRSMMPGTGNADCLGWVSLTPAEQSPTEKSILLGVIRYQFWSRSPGNRNPANPPSSGEKRLRFGVPEGLESDARLRTFLLKELEKGSRWVACHGMDPHESMEMALRMGALDHAMLPLVVRCEALRMQETLVHKGLQLAAFPFVREYRVEVIFNPSNPHTSALLSCFDGDEDQP
jgi:hypothetical protein